MDRARFTSKGITPAATVGKLQTAIGPVAISAASKAIMARDIAFLNKLVAAQQAAHLGDAAKLGKELGAGNAGGISDIPGIGDQGTDRRIGGVPTGDDATHEADVWAQNGMQDPLAGLGNQHPHGTVVGAPDMPGRGDLVGQDGGRAPDTDTHSQDRSGRSTSSGVWVQRQTERSSSDGSQTWGSTLYGDHSNNYYRSDYHVDRSDDGGVTTKETVFGAHGEPIKTTLTVQSPDGTTTETTTNHATGETTVEHPVDKTPDPEPEENQAEGTPARSANPAPRGWYNPITGQSQNAGLRTNNNQVNPGREQGSQPEPAEPLRIDPKILVVNPLPDAAAGTGGAPRITSPDNIGTDTIDPPRPQS